MSLGQLPGTDKTILACKNVAGWTSIYTITSALPPEFYRSLARYAGVHIYNDKNDTLYASKSYLTICADKEGLRTIKFPHKFDVFNPFNNEQLCQNTNEFRRNFQGKEVLTLRYSRI